MNKDINNIKTVEKFKGDMKGVFTLADLKGMFPSEHPKTFYKTVENLERAKILQRFTRGIYVAEGFDPAAASQKICRNSYISFETVLANHLVIGTVPAHEIRAVKIGKRREYRCRDFTVLQIGIAGHLYFGFETADGVNFATAEKALLDTLYFHGRGMRFCFDIYSDADLRRVNMALMKKYLSRYKNPRFVEFASRYLEGRLP